MRTRIIELDVKRQIISIVSDTTEIVNNTRHYLRVHFTFDDEWDDIVTRTAVFQGSYGKALMSILDSSNDCFIPFELLKQESFEISVFGDDLLTTAPIKIYMLKSGPVIGKKPTDDEDILWYNQVLAELKGTLANANAHSDNNDVVTLKEAKDYTDANMGSYASNLDILNLFK